MAVDDRGYVDDGIVHVTMTFGFREDQDIPALLTQAPATDPELDFNREEAPYFLSRLTLGPADRKALPAWQRRIFIGLAHNAINPAESFELPPERTIVTGGHLEL